MASGPKIAISSNPRHDTGLDADRLSERLGAYMKRLVDEGHVPNAMTLVSRHGKVAYCGGTGLQNDGSKGSLTDKPKPLSEDTVHNCPTPPAHAALPCAICPATPASRHLSRVKQTTARPRAAPPRPAPPPRSRPL